MDRAYLTKDGPWAPAATRRSVPPGWFWLVGVVAVSAAGCGRKIPVAPVEGTVRLDGRPLEDVAVTFVPDHLEGTTGPHSSGKTDASGQYQLRCEDAGDGAPIEGTPEVTLPPYTTMVLRVCPGT